jgi:hypothetical protein
VTIEWVKKFDVLALGEGILTDQQRMSVVCMHAEKFPLCVSVECEEEGHRRCQAQFNGEKALEEIARMAEMTGNAGIIRPICDTVLKYLKSDADDDAEGYYLGYL